MQHPGNDRNSTHPSGRNLKQFVFELLENDGAREVNGLTARKHIIRLTQKLQCTGSDLRENWQSLDQTFKNFTDLPQKIQDALSAAADFYMREHHFLSSGMLRFLAHGLLAGPGALIVHWGWVFHKNAGPRLGRPLIVTGRKLIKIGYFSARVYRKLIRYTPFYRAPILNFLWHYTKADPWNLISNSILNIPLAPHVHPVYKKAAGPGLVAALLGIDLLPSRGKLYFIEGNFNAGHNVKRHELSPAGDTVCVHLLNWAKISGYKAIHFYPGNFFEEFFPRDLEMLWRKMAAKNGMEIRIIDDPYIGSPWPRPVGLQRALDRCQLLINGRYIHSPISELISVKGLLEREIRRQNDASVGNPVLLPKEIHSERDLPDPGRNPFLPNLIIKNIDLDMGEGISLYKTRELPDRAHLQKHQCYEFVPPDFCEKAVDGVMKRFVCLFRAYLLITADGFFYMGARKDISPVPLPDSLPFGQVPDKSMFITNVNLGAYSVPHTGLEDEACRRAVEAIGSVICRFIGRKFRIGSVRRRTE
ncbi:MAG: hypothetical protein JXR49_04620 [Acidobacteria bacterium]|nr:hypothetical protein [Acidobacteriota bacterium]